MAREENAVQKACLQLLHLCGCVAWRNQSTPAMNEIGRFKRFNGRKGVSDIIGVLPKGVALFVECKSAKGRQSPEQKQFQAEVEAAGAVYILARSVRDLEIVLRDLGVLR